MFVQEYKILAHVADGTFSKVFKASGRIANEFYALKMQRRSRWRELKREVDLLTTISSTGSPFLNHFYEAFQSKKHVFFVMEYLDGGSLCEHLHKEGTFSEGRSCYYGACLLSALEALHDVHIAHRDVSLKNIVLNRRGQAVLVDFGRCCKCPADEITFDLLLDLVDLGSVIHEMLTGKKSEFIQGRRMMSSSNLSTKAFKFLEFMCIPRLNEFNKHENIVKSMKMQYFFEKIDWNGFTSTTASEGCETKL